METINGFPDYKVNTNGDVFSFRRGGKQRQLKKRYCRGGYVSYIIRDSFGKKTNLSAHRIVANQYIKNDNYKPCVNHINGVRDDNRVENLEWCTYSENIKHGIALNKKTNVNAKLSEVMHFILKSEFSRIKSQKEVSNKYKIPYKIIQNLYHGKYYKNYGE